jgi:hypothetical protein
MNPQKLTLGAPLREYAAVKEPYASSSLVDIARYVVIFGRIRRGYPTSGVLLQLITYNADPAEVIKRDRTK